MYKLLFVDDEVIMRDGIQNIIDWKCYNVELVGVLEDGYEAMEIALRECPDIVITDILMPFMDGLELTKKLREMLPQTKIIIISGYEEFKYAQQAIEYKVHSYLLKPFAPSKLIEVVKEVIAEIDSVRNKKFVQQDIVDYGVSFCLPFDEINNLRSEIKLGYTDKLDELIDNIFKYATEGYEENDNFKIVTAKHTALSILNIGNKIISEMAIVNDELQKKQEAYNNMFDNCQSVSNIKKCIKDFLLEIIEFIRSSKHRNDRLVVQKCKEIIKKNYMDDTLCLNSIVEQIHLSSGNLSQKFKQETGWSINNYIISVRLERAKELLRTTDKKLYEIACEVGYKDEFYLSNAFKKNIGMRPKEFRECL